MRKTLALLLFLLSANLLAQQDDAPVVGVSDKRVEIYGFKNAKVIVDYQTTLENTDIIVSNGRIEAVGQNLVFPKGAVIIDLTGKTVYPSFIDIYAGNYGIKSPTTGTDPNPMAAMMQQGGRQNAPTLPDGRIADYWNDGINATYDVAREFIPDTKTAGER